MLVTLPTLLKKEDPLDRSRPASRRRRRSPQGDKALRLRSGKKDKLDKYSNFLEPQNEEEYSAVRLKLLQAGYRSKNAVRTFHALQFALGMAFPGAGVIYACLLGHGRGRPRP